MSKKPDYIDAKRRGFLQSSVLVTGAAAAASASSVKADVLPATAELSVEKRKHAGYEETDRVREYYAKARF